MSFGYIVYDWAGNNVAMFHFINGLFAGHHATKILMLIISFMGDFETIIGILAVIWIMLCYLYVRRPNVNLLTARKPWLDIVLLMTISVFISAAIGYTFKFNSYFPRPLCLLRNINMIPDFGSTIEQIIKKRCFGDGSFPSMHATMSAIIVTAFWPISNFYTRFLLFTYAILVGVSRIAIGVHFPVDIIGGYVFGCIITSICNRFVGKIYSVLYILAAKYANIRNDNRTLH